MNAVNKIEQHNPIGTDGFEFVEYAHPEPEKLHALFKQMGFAPVARHRSKAITLYRQGDVNYLVNEEPGSHAATKALDASILPENMRWNSSLSTCAA